MTDIVNKRRIVCSVAIMLLCAFMHFGEASAQDVKVEQKGAAEGTMVQQGGSIPGIAHCVETTSE